MYNFVQNTKQKVISLEKTRSKQKTPKKGRRKFRAFYYWKFISFPIRQFLQFAAIKCSLHINIYFICRCSYSFREAFVCLVTQKLFNFKIVLPWFVLSYGKILFIMKMDLLHENVNELLSGFWIIFNKWFRGNDY